MNEFVKQYELITQEFQCPEYDYTTPEEQGEAIKRCSILETTNIEYSNEIKQF